MNLRSISTVLYAKSYAFNRRNLEHLWYPAWNDALHNLIGDIPEFSVAPQYPLWVTKDEDESEDDAQSIVTVPEGKTITRYPDYAIIHLAMVADNASPSDSHRVEKETVVLVVEQKKAPSRRIIAGEAFKKALRNLLLTAKFGTFLQAAIFLQKYPREESIIAIAASGPHWSSTRYHRSNLTLFRDDFSDIMKNQDWDSLEEYVLDSGWDEPVKLNTPPSTKRFKTILRELNQLCPPGRTANIFRFIILLSVITCLAAIATYSYYIL